MVAIRSKTGLPFRRSGVEFAPDRWTAVENPTEAMLAEAMLEVREVSGLDDEIFGPDMIEMVAAESLVPVRVTIIFDKLGRAQIDGFADVSFVFAETLNEEDPSRIVDFGSLIPEGWFDVEEVEPDPFEGVKGLGKELKDALIAAGIPDRDALFAAPDEAILAISGIGPKLLKSIREQAV